MPSEKASHAKNLRLFNRLYRKLVPHYHETRLMLAQRGNYVMDVDMTTAEIAVGKDRLDRRYFALSSAVYHTELSENRAGWVCLWEKRINDQVEIMMTVRTMGGRELAYVLDEEKVFVALKKTEMILDRFVLPAAHRR